MKIKSTRSFDNLAKHAMLTKQITKNLVSKATDFSTYFSLFLANSRGKDKLLSVLQYLFELFCICGKHSNIQHLSTAYKKNELLDMLIYYHLKENISSARKVFRLFRYFDQIKGMAKILRSDKPLPFKILSIFTYFCSAMYYFCDNTLWFLGILIKSGAANKSLKRGWKYYKNSFSLSRIVAYLIILIYSVYLQNKDISKLKQYLKKLEQEHSCTKQLGPLLIQGRRKIRFLYLEMVISFLRYVMLTSSLKLRWHEKLDPIFVAGCGLFSSILNLIKTIYEKKIIVKLQKQQTPVSLTKFESMLLI